jgi:hypothetical protein
VSAWKIHTDISPEFSAQHDSGGFVLRAGTLAACIWMMLTSHAGCRYFSMAIISVIIK